MAFKFVFKIAELGTMLGHTKLHSANSGMWWYAAKLQNFPLTTPSYNQLFKGACELLAAVHLILYNLAGSITL